MNRPSRETLIRYFKGKCLPHEIELVELYLSLDVDKEFVESCIENVWDELEERTKQIPDDRRLEKFKQELDQQLRTQVQLPPLDYPNKRRYFRLSLWTKSVAAAVLLIGAGLWAFHNIQPKISMPQVKQAESEGLPGDDKAFLTLSDGSIITLSETENGQIAAQHGLRIEKTIEGEIVYKVDGQTATDDNASNSIVTPNGGQYRVILPDGSKALLNAASSLTYPVKFTGKERRVKMSGEVYFEIAKAVNSKNQHIPFFVETLKQEIQVLGTTFNVSAYQDDTYHYTTLVEGSVRLTSTATGGSTLLKPGEHAIVDRDISVSAVNIKQELAWVNDYFVFRSEELQSILKKIARWYDIEVDCPSDLGKKKFTGKVSRSQPLSAVIEMLSSVQNINVELKERRLIVKK
ncbi:FecR family protein [Sphingobacterium phlebotomi]|uniref:FecR family protein n=1 Tax=Sphingobacterium phlebotomi TaxID=2605433 RepID=A0A5D4H8P4_9SPHI|nr:FecR domain-containing protein [Sphingobacterium phlebotomi]TYR36957.1 FecR family protein [Sphingobacterium phlebotomi]